MQHDYIILGYFSYLHLTRKLLFHQLNHTPAISSSLLIHVSDQILAEFNQTMNE